MVKPHAPVSLPTTNSPWYTLNIWLGGIHKSSGHFGEDKISLRIAVFNQTDAQNLFHFKFYFMPLHVSSTSAHHQEVKIVLHSLWYHHTTPIGVMIPEAV